VRETGILTWAVSMWPSAQSASVERIPVSGGIFCQRDKIIQFGDGITYYGGAI